jgi:type IV secretory pathway VirB2 component (pilin)
MCKKRTLFRKKFHQLNKIIFIGFVLFTTSPLFAGTTDSLPWETPGQKIEGWLTGSVARIVAIVLIAVSGIMFANGEHGGAFRRMMGIMFGISISVGAVTLYSSLGFSGAEV